MPPSKYCYYLGCSNNSRNSENVHFIPFPNKTQHEKCLKWIELCGLRLNIDQIKGYIYICSKHFVDSNGPTEMNPDPCFHENSIVVGAQLNLDKRLTVPCKPIPTTETTIPRTLNNSYITPKNIVCATSSIENGNTDPTRYNVLSATRKVNIGSAFETWLKERTKRNMTNEEFALYLLSVLKRSMGEKRVQGPTEVKTYSRDTPIVRKDGEPLPKFPRVSYGRNKSTTMVVDPSPSMLMANGDKTESGTSEEQILGISEDDIVSSVNNQTVTIKQEPLSDEEVEGKTSHQDNLEKSSMENDLVIISHASLMRLVIRAFGQTCSHCGDTLDYRPQAKGSVMTFTWACASSPEPPHTKGNWTS